MTTPPPDRDLADLALSRARSRASDKPARRRRSSSTAPLSGSRDPQPLGTAVDRLVVEQDWTDDLLAAGLIADWAHIVGPELAEHVTPEAFDPQSRRLHLRADSTAWATQVRLLLPTLRERIAQEVGPVGSIEIAGPAAPSWVRGPRHVPGRGPRDTYG